MAFACLQLLARLWMQVRRNGGHLSAPNQCGNVAKIALLCKLQLCAKQRVRVGVNRLCFCITWSSVRVLQAFCVSIFVCFFTIMFCCGNATDNKLFYCDIYLFQSVYYVYEFADR